MKRLYTTLFAAILLMTSCGPKADKHYLEALCKFIPDHGMRVDAKNYLTETELQRLKLLTSQFLDYAEFQALEQNPMTMADWVAALDDQILRLRKNILEGSGTVSHQEAIEKAEHEFEIYREREMRLLESDFDKAVKALLDNKDDKEEAPDLRTQRPGG